MNYTYQKPLSVTSQFSFCGLPFRMDTYSGCSFSCTYCFARLRGGKSHSKKLRATESDHVINKFKRALKDGKYSTSIISEYIRHKMPVHFGGMSDPFQPIEKQLKISYDILKFLISINYPVVLSTRSDLASSEPYFSLLKDAQNLVVQFSFSTLKEKESLKIEPYTPGPAKLLKTIEKLSSAGVKTSIRWQPFIPYFSETPNEFVAKIVSVGAAHLGFEHLKFPLEKRNRLRENLKNITNIDVYEEYLNQNGRVDGRELILSTTRKLHLALTVKKIANQNGLTFGAADNEFQYLSDTNCCCSGVDQFKGFENWNKFQISYAIKKSIGREIRFDSIGHEWQPQGAIDQHLNSKSRISSINGPKKVYDYVVDRWQNLDSPFNPTKYHGVIFNGKVDSSGFKVYEWNKKD